MQPQSKTTEEEQLKIYIQNAEKRHIEYKQLQFEFRYGPEWFKEFLRDCKNSNEAMMNKFRKSLTDLRQGMNPF